MAVAAPDHSIAASPSDRRANWQGLGDGLSRAVEMAVIYNQGGLDDVMAAAKELGVDG